MPLGRPFRGASTLRYWELPGVVACYSPWGAPSYVASKQNMARGLLGVYTVTEGVAPTWTPWAGWAGDGSSKWLNTNIVHASGWSMLIGFSGAGADNGYLAGGLDDVTTRMHIAACRTGVAVYGNGGSTSMLSAYGSGVMAVAGQTGYKDGLSVASIPAWSGINEKTIYVLALNYDGVVALYSRAVISNFSVFSRTLTAAEVWQASLQMAHPEVPEWNPWARQRQWWIPAGAAVTPTGRIILPHGVLQRRSGHSIPDAIGASVIQS